MRHPGGREYVPQAVPVAGIPPETVKEYTCSKCGITILDHKNWGPRCPATGRRVCDICCYECEYRKDASGLRRCELRSKEERYKAARRRSRERFDEEAARISAMYHEAKRKEAKRRAR